ncbi:hypothetical protein HanIR_Chr10g0472711 [Helianthus annuus]|nr:hypothetical protein HanIR_Chr10g0472711 [Helianthus annuus]
MFLTSGALWKMSAIRFSIRRFSFSFFDLIRGDVGVECLLNLNDYSRNNCGHLISYQSCHSAVGNPRLTTTTIRRHLRGTT